MRIMLTIIVTFVALAAVGCGGGDSTESEPTTTYAAPSEPTYSNQDGSPPQCVTLYSTGERVCNTDSQIVESTRLLLNGYDLNQMLTDFRNECTSRGYEIGVCVTDAGSAMQLVIHNQINGLPQ